MYLNQLRSGHGSDTRRRQLRAQLAKVDPQLRHQRNVEKLRLAQFQHMARTGTSPRSPAELAREIGECAERLAKLDAEIERLPVQSEPAPVAAPAPRKDHPDPAVIAEARTVLRGRLWLAAGLLDGLPLRPSRCAGCRRRSGWRSASSEGREDRAACRPQSGPVEVQVPSPRQPKPARRFATAEDPPCHQCRFVNTPEPAVLTATPSDTPSRPASS